MSKEKKGLALVEFSNVQAAVSVSTRRHIHQFLPYEFRYLVSGKWIKLQIDSCGLLFCFAFESVVEGVQLRKGFAWKPAENFMDERRARSRHFIHTLIITGTKLTPLRISTKSATSVWCCMPPLCCLHRTSREVLRCWRASCSPSCGRLPSCRNGQSESGRTIRKAPPPPPRLFPAFPRLQESLFLLRSLLHLNRYLEWMRYVTVANSLCAF